MLTYYWFDGTNFSEKCQLKSKCFYSREFIKNVALEMAFFFGLAAYVSENT